MKNWGKTNRQKSRVPESQRCVCVCIWSTHYIQKPLIRSTGSLSVCQLSVGVSRTSAASCTHSITHLIKSPACLYAQYSCIRKTATLHSYCPFFLRGPPNNIHNKPSGLCFPPKGRLLDLNFSFLVDSKSTCTVTCSNCFPRALGILSCSEAAIDLFRAGGIIITPQVEGADLHFPLCYTCFIGVWLSWMRWLRVCGYCITTILSLYALSCSPRDRLQMAGLLLV